MNYTVLLGAVPSLTASAQNLRDRWIKEYFGDTDSAPFTVAGIARIKAINEDAAILDAVISAQPDLLTLEQILKRVYPNIHSGTSEYIHGRHVVGRLLKHGYLATVRVGRTVYYRLVVE